MTWTTWFLPLVLFLFVACLIAVIQVEREQQRLKQSAALLSAGWLPTLPGRSGRPNQPGLSSQIAIAQLHDKSINPTI